MTRISVLKTILFTGGGSAGHVLPCVPLIARLKQEGFSLFYVGREVGIEKTLIEPLGIPYRGISTGKLRRYFSAQNFIDPLRILLGIVQAFVILYRIKPKLVFSKGGFVSVPVVFAAWLWRIPVLIHESDLTLGLANRLVYPFAKKLCLAFPPRFMSEKDSKKCLVTGLPIRDSLFCGEKSKGQALIPINTTKPTLLVMGGGNGSKVLNAWLRTELKQLSQYQVIHLCGQGNRDKTLDGLTGYYQFEYVDESLPHLFALADVVISRAGANTIYELLCLKKPHILIPLSRRTSRGEQIANAHYCQKMFGSVVIEEEHMAEFFLPQLQNLLTHLPEHRAKLEKYAMQNGTNTLLALIKTYL